ncbi:MAG: TOBE domain-containing protein, partial [Tabrizicola sp.]
EQVGKPLDLYRDPDNRFVAGFIGSPAMNFQNATVSRAGVIDVPGLATDVATKVALPGAGAKVVTGLRPQSIRLVQGETHRVEITEALGGVTFVHLMGPTGEKLVVEARGDMTPELGSKLGIDFDAGDVMVFTADEAGLRMR